MPSLFDSLPAKAGFCVVVTALVTGAGVLFASPSRHAATPAADPLADRLGSVDTTTMTVRRASFCAAVPDATAAIALGSAVTDHTTWQPGERTRLGRVDDVLDEYGCSWTAASGASARAWVFAPPVTPARATALRKDAPAGCRPLAAMPAFGAQTSALTCGEQTLVRGRFGDAWLSCELSDDDVDRVGRWCLAVARAAA